MEMEMDKFLAKKSHIYAKSIFQFSLTSSEKQLEFQLVKSVLHLCLKSMYERVRLFKLKTAKTWN
jgi:hypothetical protein